MSVTGTYAYRDGRLVRITEKPPLRGTPDAAVRSFRENAMYGYKRIEEKGQRFLGTRKTIERAWDRAARVYNQPTTN